MRVLHTETRTKLKKPSKKCEALKDSTTVGSHSRPLAKELGKKIILPESSESWVLKERPANGSSGHGEMFLQEPQQGNLSVI